MDPYEPTVGMPTRLTGPQANGVRECEVTTIDTAAQTVDVLPRNSRAGIIGVPYPDWYEPAVGDRVLVVFLDGNSQQPRILAPAGGQVTATSRRAEFDVGNGSSVHFDLDHELGTRTVAVVVSRNVAPFDQVTPASIQFTSATSLRVTFGAAPTLNQWHVTIRD